MTNNQAQSASPDHFVEQGRQKIRWAEMHQGLLQRLRKQFSESQPFAGLTIGICLHVEPKTAVLCAVLQAGGANVVITGSPGTTKNDVAAVELDPMRALEAVLDGMFVTSLDEALKIGEVFFTATGRPGVIAAESIDRLPDGAILANAGHFSWEIDIVELRRRATKIERLRACVELITLEDGRRITLLAQGEMLNLAGGGGNPIETMDLGLALQAQSLAYLAAHYKDLPVGPQPVPGEINATVARWMVENLSRRGSASFTV